MAWQESARLTKIQGVGWTKALVERNLCFELTVLKFDYLQAIFAHLVLKTLQDDIGQWTVTNKYKNINSGHYIGYVYD